MKPKNFPARKLRRKLRAENGLVLDEWDRLAIENARQIRTKKNRKS